MSILWCTNEDVADRIAFLSADTIDSSHIIPRIERARDNIIDWLGGKFSVDTLAAWTDENTVPPRIRAICAMEAAALVLHELTDNEVISDRTSKAYGFRREVTDTIQRIRDDELIVATSQTDSSAVGTQNVILKSSTHGDTPVYSDERMDRFTGTET